MRHNKILAAFSIGACLLAFIPGYLFFKEVSGGELVLPFRHLDSLSQNALEVGRQTYIDGGIMATGITNELFSNLKLIHLGTFYIPPLVFILLLFGIFVSQNKTLFVLALWGWLVFLSGLYEATPLYRFLYHHVFYMKYMRNFQYFLWLNTLPLIILIAAEHLRLLLNKQTDPARHKFVWGGLVIGCHGIFLFYLSRFDNVLMSSYVCLFLSLIFFLVLIMRGIKRNIIAAGFIFFLILLQPVEVYHYLAKNSLKVKEPYAYDNLREGLCLPDRSIVEASRQLKNKRILRGDFSGAKLTSAAEATASPNSWLSLRSNMVYADLVNPNVRRFYPLLPLSFGILIVLSI